MDIVLACGITTLSHRHGLICCSSGLGQGTGVCCLPRPTPGTGTSKTGSLFGEQVKNLETQSVAWLHELSQQDSGPLSALTKALKCLPLCLNENAQTRGTICDSSFLCYSHILMDLSISHPLSLFIKNKIFKPRENIILEYAIWNK